MRVRGSAAAAVGPVRDLPANVSGARVDDGTAFVTTAREGHGGPWWAIFAAGRNSVDSSWPWILRTRNAIARMPRDTRAANAGCRCGGC